MSNDDVLVLARQAGFRTGRVDYQDGKDSFEFAEPVGNSCLVELRKFAELVEAATLERETK